MTEGVKDSLKTHCPECGNVVRPVRTSTNKFGEYDKQYLRVHGDGTGYHDTSITKTAWACVNCGLEISAREIAWDTESLRAECFNRLKNRTKRNEFVKYKKVLNRMIYQENIAFKLKGFTFDAAVEKAIEKVTEDVRLGINYQNLNKWERNYVNILYQIFYEADGYISLNTLSERIREKYAKKGNLGSNLPTRQELSCKYLFRLPLQKYTDSNVPYYKLRREDK